MHPTRRWIATAVLTATAAGTTTAAMAGASSAAPSKAARASAATSTEIASTTLGTDLKVTLRAYRVGAYDATVYVAAFRYAKGAWRPAWHERVPGTWFYYPLTGRGGVCSLRVTQQPGKAPTVDLSLLISPSIGCSPTRHFTIR